MYLSQGHMLMFSGDLVLAIAFDTLIILLVKW